MNAAMSAASSPAGQSGEPVEEMEHGIEPRLVFVTGKGGVGKTKVAAALGAKLAREHPSERLLLLTIGNAASLGGALSMSLDRAPRAHPEWRNLFACAIDPAEEWRLALDRDGDSIRSLLGHASGLGQANLSRLLKRPWPAVEQVVALGRLEELLADEKFDRVVVDGDPTGQALEWLGLPRRSTEWVDMIDGLLEKERYVRSRFRGGGESADDRFLTRMRETLVRLDRLLGEGAEFVVVSAPGEVVARETERLLGALASEGRRVGAVVHNRPAESVSAPVFQLPVERPLILLPAGVRLVVVAGKGGVGKTTVSLGLALAWPKRPGEKVLVVSVDPAHSLWDAMGQKRPAHDRPVVVSPGVAVLELDFAAAYRARIEPLRKAAREAADQLENAHGSRFRVAFEPDALRNVLETLPPGLHEIAALLWVSEAISADQPQVIVLDTPPASHFTRLLRTHGPAREHLRALLRALLDQPASAHLGALAREVAKLATELDRLGSRLRDGASSQMMLVSTPEIESLDAARQIHATGCEMGLSTWGLVLNQAEGEVPRPSFLSPRSPVVGLHRQPAEPRGPERLHALLRVERGSP